MATIITVWDFTIQQKLEDSGVIVEVNAAS